MNLPRAAVAANRLSQRLHEPERMDDPALDRDLHRQALVGLSRLNWFGRSAGLLWPALQRAAGDAAPLNVLDVACGGGDVTTALARRARRTQRSWRFEGCDLSETALTTASERSRSQRLDIDWFKHDALEDDFPKIYDVVMCSLFLHHLDEQQAIALLARMRRAARRAVIISDLRRSTVGHALTWVGCHLLTRSPVVHFDGPLSVRCAFTTDEARALAEQAGLSGARIASRFPVRWLLEWHPS